MGFTFKISTYDAPLELERAYLHRNYVGPPFLIVNKGSIFLNYNVGPPFKISV